QVYRSASSAILRAFGLSVLLQINVVVHFVLIARGVGIMVPVESMFLIVPVAIFVMMLPLSINAIGVREAIFVFFFSLYGVPDFQALALAWVSYGFTLIQGVLGGIVFAVRR
ncbi:MAG: lysylphosphatidylglycerol synthase domain-containing protein, partial [Arenicellales bacterium]|nr:lysylphosphatidylglycerol synthase domain-containing protein [Arenicellales bacterium]